jgi:hypothetical protein
VKSKFGISRGFGRAEAQAIEKAIEDAVKAVALRWESEQAVPPPNHLAQYTRLSPFLSLAWLRFATSSTARIGAAGPTQLCETFPYVIDSQARSDGTTGTIRRSRRRVNVGRDSRLRFAVTGVGHVGAVLESPPQSSEF